MSGPSSFPRGTPAAGRGRRALVWAPGDAGGSEALKGLLRSRGLEPEPVGSAPGLIFAALTGPAPAAVVLVQPAELPRAREAVSVLEEHARGVACWRFEPPPAGPGRAGLLGRVDGRLGLDAPAAAVGGGEPGWGVPGWGVPGSEHAAGDAGRGHARISREELAMLLGPTRTLGRAGAARAAGGDAG